MELRKKVVYGFIWTASEKLGSMLLQIVVSIVLARLLEPSDFGLIAIFTAFSVVATSIIDSGFSQALIYRSDTGPRDYSSVFWFNGVLAVVVYGILLASAGPLSRFLNMPGFDVHAPLFFLILPVSALGIIQVTLLTRGMNFRKLSGINFMASLLSGVVAITMAVRGHGLMSLVWQHLTLHGSRTILLWIVNTWRPTAGFSMASVKKLFPYGSRLFATGLISQSFSNISQIIVGKFYAPAQLGFYSQSHKFKDLVTNTVSHSIMTVSFPAFSSMQNDLPKMKATSRQVIHMLWFLLCPLMLGLTAIAPEVFPLALTSKWDPAIPYFRIFCLSGLWIPIANVGLNIIKATGASGLVLRLEIIKKTFALIVISGAAFVSVRAMVWAYLLWTFFEFVLNMLYAGRRIDYSLRELGSDGMIYIAMGAAMYATVMAVPALFETGMVTTLVVKIATGIVTYAILTFIFKPAALHELMSILRNTGGRAVQE